MPSPYTYRTASFSSQNKLENTSVFHSSFSGKEKDPETGYHYFGARYYNSDLSLWLSVDPMSDKYPSLTPYNYCAWNPMKLVDPNGMDTLSVLFNKENKKWEISDHIISKGNDVINVTGQDGDTRTYSFSEGVYGNRVNMILLEDSKDNDESFGVYHLSGEKKAGFFVQPSSFSKKHKQVGPGTYTSYLGKGERWYNYIGLSGGGVSSGVRIHYGTGRSWSTGCLIISNAYSLNASGSKRFDLESSRDASWSLAQYAGATSRTSKPMGGEKRIRDWYTYEEFKSPTIYIKR